MEAVALSTATSALNLVVKTATTAIADKIGFLLGVQEELFFIKEELDMMQAFLEAASTEKVKSVVVNRWIKQVQELAFDVEDCLQEASVYLMKKKCLPAMFSVKKRDHIARKIRVLKTRIEDVSNRNQRYNLINKDNGEHAYDESTFTKSIANVQSLLVGLDEPKKKLAQIILKEDGKVISVVGMGGVGKTTLVREVYGCQEVRDEFKHFSWVTIQHPLNTKEFIEILAKQILAKLIPPNQILAKLIPPKQIMSNAQEVDTKGEIEEENKIKELLSKQTIKEMVTEYLKDKKYLIVLDDLSSLSEWDKIKDVLPPVKGRRIIVTTRYKILAETITHPSENIYKIKKLSKKDAFDLFCKAVYKTSNYCLESDEGPSRIEITEDDSKLQIKFITNTITEEEAIKVQEQSTTIHFTKDMDTNARLIIESCDRLPLAIVTIGSYLATKPKTSAEWMKMHNQLSSELHNNPELGVVNTVLSSSYEGMPYHLKPCLLYLSVFHNHKEIRRSRIIRRWMADGYVMADRKKTAEDVGKGYFYDLMGRSLIQPSQVSTIINGDIKRCNIHDMMYELILAKAEDENMVSMVDHENLITMTDKVRHLVITGGSRTGGKFQERVEFSHMRSLSIFGEVGDYLSYPRMKLVRVLDLESTLNLNDRDLRSLGKLRHLKYLGLRGTKIRKLPNSLGKLSELETLDIRNTGVVRLPTVLTNLHKLSYLRAGSVGNIDCTTPFEVFIGHIGSMSHNWQEKFIRKCFASLIIDVKYSFCTLCCLFPLLPCVLLDDYHKTKAKNHFSGGVRVPQGIDKLRSLNIFGIIDIGGSKSLAKDLQNLTNLRKLAVTNFTEENGKILAKVIDGLRQLRSLVLKAKGDSGLRCCLDSISSPPKYLQSLKLHSPLGELPVWISSLENLGKIHLRDTVLRGGIKAIQELPNLKIIHMLYKTFEGFPELLFGESTFPMLQVLIIEQWVKSVSIEKTAFKRLELLRINYCNRMSGLDFLEQLKEMEVGRYDNKWNREFVRNIEEQLKKLPKQPVLRLI